MSENYTVVVAEDEELLLGNIVAKINEVCAGFTVAATAQTGDRALELVRELKPDMVITDVKMPVMNGIELLKRVHTEFPSIKLIIISGFSDFEYVQQALRLQVCEYLLKPVDRQELKNALIKQRTLLDLETKSFSAAFADGAQYATPDMLAEAIHGFIVKNYDKDINLNEIAASLNYSASYISRLFFQKYRQTPAKFIISLRTQRACYMLSHCPGASVRQIGEAVGYSDQGYFSRAFKKQTGCSPAEYRRLHADQPEPE